MTGSARGWTRGAAEDSPCEVVMRTYLALLSALGLRTRGSTSLIYEKN